MAAAQNENAINPPHRDALTTNARDSAALVQQLKGYGKLTSPLTTESHGQKTDEEWI